MSTIIPLNPSLKISLLKILVTVNYLESIEKMIQNGNYDRYKTFLILLKELGITPYPRVKTIREYEMQLVSPDRYYSTLAIERGIKILDRIKPWYPARIEHLLAFGALMPEEQKNGQIIALATNMVVSREDHVPRLENLHNERGISIIENNHKDSDVWKPTDRFLIVRPH